MVELMAVLAIMGLGIAAMLNTIGSSIDLATTTENNIKGIGIAREWLEALINIRDTNWLRFSSDKLNCWKSMNYNGSCIGNSTPPSITDGRYTVYMRNGVWYLSGATNINYQTTWTGYTQMYQVGLDNDGFATQSWVSTTTRCTNTITRNCFLGFTRELVITSNGTGILNLESIVRWKEKGSVNSLEYRTSGARNDTKGDRNVQLRTSISNWKSNF